MSRADRRWRPSDADRDRYASAISQAFAEGRIDAADMESRTALVHEAKSISDLDALVDDMPPPAPAPTQDAPAPEPQTRRVLLVIAALVFGALVLSGIISAVLYNTLGSDGASSADPVSADPPPAAEAPAPVPEEEAPPDEADLPPIDTDLLSLFTLDGLNELWTAAAATEPSTITIRPDRASLTVRADSAHRALATVDYQGGLLLPPEPWRDLGDGEADADLFYSWADVTPEAVLAAIAGTPAAAGQPDVTVGYVIIDHQWEGQVTIRVYPEGDTGIGYVRWDATGQRVIRVY